MSQRRILPYLSNKSSNSRWRTSLGNLPVVKLLGLILMSREGKDQAVISGFNNFKSDLVRLMCNNNVQKSAAKENNLPTKRAMLCTVIKRDNNWKKTSWKLFLNCSPGRDQIWIRCDKTVQLVIPFVVHAITFAQHLKGISLFPQ